MRVLSFLLLLCTLNASAAELSDSLLTPFEKSKGLRTATYAECISFYKELDRRSAFLTIQDRGKTDGFEPLWVVTLSQGTRSKPVLFINNGIHPGEPEGIDACMMLARNLVLEPSLRKFLEKITIVIIPIYNVEGMKNRNSTSRANQNGPEEYGFRGNGKNLDLNRDFIKCDSRNVMGFIQVFQEVQPSIFVDTHTSNGADYQYVMTYIATQKDKLNPVLSAYMQKTLVPFLEKDMKKNKLEMSPYVDTKKVIPDSGIVGFLETARYSTGYTTLFNTMGFVTETHMLKPFDARVRATYLFLKSLTGFMVKNAEALTALRTKADLQTVNTNTFGINYKLDTSSFTTYPFKGFQSGYKASKVSGQQRLYYDRTKPFTKSVRFYNNYKASDSVRLPFAFVIPQQYERVIQLLSANGVKMQRLTKELKLAVTSSYIEDFKTYSNPFEGHYVHYNTRIRQESDSLLFEKGSYLIFPNTLNKQFLVEVLDPRAQDSYFNWNFFDNILSQKEHFSDYVFEDLADSLLQKDQALKNLLEEKKALDSLFAANGQAQLEFVYRHSNYFEKSWRRYPVARIEKGISLPLE